MCSGVATASAPQTITVTNSGNAPLIVSTVATTETQRDRIPVLVHYRREPDLHDSGSLLPTATGSRSGVLTATGMLPADKLRQRSPALAALGHPLSQSILLTFRSTTITPPVRCRIFTISILWNSDWLQTPSVIAWISRLLRTPAGRALAQCRLYRCDCFYSYRLRDPQRDFSITDDVGTQTASLSGIGTRLQQMLSRRWRYVCGAQITRRACSADYADQLRRSAIRR